MLNADTKRNIDAARDVLVGKVPDPKAQVDQITTALIYKFMADLDQGSTDLGGKATFFSGEYQKFAWQNLIDTRLSGEARLDLYTQAISSLQNNPNLPQLFRDIFKNAFLPYRDPQTLHLFLKEINKFTYSHSEELGNAFEYLLSILGSQGDAGQFRTPRHIIDFLVQVVDPQKHETILDPACGTAGFLISSYKHILNANTSPNAANMGDQLTPAQRQTLTQNIHGYDISPDMVKLSLVNLYLHDFASPNIHEYDTLTSEKNWDTSFDVILANPPFMTPKGGIRPHKRFQIQAKRSEVLFVDYILEHLSPNGRAAVIVPEGIIFKSENAYKQLRKLLVQDGLIAVISLPAGVFNPYSGVKTSVLIFNALHAKTTDQVLFIKIKNDGFDLGAQRRPITQNDLPHALELIKAWVNGASIDDPIALIVPKTTLAEGGDYNLTADRYKVNITTTKTSYPMVKLGEVCEIISGQSPKGEYYNNDGNGTPFHQGKTLFGEIYLHPANKWTTDITKIALPNDIVMSVRAPVGPVNLVTEKICIGRGLCSIRPKNVDNWYLFYFLRSIESEIVGNGGAVFDSINAGQIQNITIPLPPLEVQKQIVATIQEKQNAINAAKTIIQTIHNQRKTFGAHLLTDPTIPTATLGASKFFSIESGGTPSSSEVSYWNGDINWVTLVDLPADDFITEISDTNRKITQIGLTKSSAKLLPVNTILISSRATIGRVGISKIPLATNQGFKNIIVKDFEKVNPYFVANIIRTKTNELISLGTGGTFKEVSKTNFSDISIPLPSLEIQKQLVDQANALEAIAAANQNLITLMEQEIENILKEI